MKIFFEHSKGFLKDGDNFLSVSAIQTNETSEYMFENGWLPFFPRRHQHWMQCRSSRLKLKPISKRRQKELSKINVTYDKDVWEIAQMSNEEKFNFGFVSSIIEDPNTFIFFFDDCFCGLLNFTEGIPYFAAMLWNESHKEHSYGTLSYYFLIDKLLKEGHDYLYISQYYDQFSYKENIQGFEWWSGSEWISHAL